MMIGNPLRPVIDRCNNNNNNNGVVMMIMMIMMLVVPVTSNNIVRSSATSSLQSHVEVEDDRRMNVFFTTSLQDYLKVKYDACTICSAPSSDAAGSNIVDVTFLNFTFTQVSCKELFDAATAGLFSSDQCTAISSNTGVLDTCACNEVAPNSTVPVSSPVAAPEPSPSIEPCYICNNDPNGTIVNVDTMVDVSFLNFPFTTASCKDIYEAAVAGTFQSDVCSELTYNSTIPSECGCNTTDYTTNTTTQFDPCPICNGDPSANITNGDAIVDLSFLDYGALADSSCQDVYEVALAGSFPPKQCMLLQENTNLQEVCGCTSDGKNETEDPSLEPCYICGGDPNATISNPDVDASDISSIALVANTTCGTLFDLATQGIFGSDVCDVFTADVDLQVQCGCSVIGNATSDTNTTDTNNSTIPPMETIPCYICGGDMNATIGNPDAILSELSFITLVNTTCDDLNTIAVDGVLEKEICQLFQNETTVQSTCGCSNYEEENTPTAAPAVLSDRPSAIVIDIPSARMESDAPSASPVAQPTKKPVVSKEPTTKEPTTEEPTKKPAQKPTKKPVQEDISNAPTIESTTWDVCYICGSENYNITKPDGIVDLSILGIGGVDGNGTCQDLFTAGLTENLPSFACASILSSDIIETECGCNEISTNSTTNLTSK